jgi:hypothetical protein
MHHGYGHAPWTRTCTIDMDMHHGHGHAPGTLTCTMDMDMHQGQIFSVISSCEAIFQKPFLWSKTNEISHTLPFRGTKRYEKKFRMLFCFTKRHETKVCMFSFLRNMRKFAKYSPFRHSVIFTNKMLCKKGEPSKLYVLEYARFASFYFFASKRNELILGRKKIWCQYWLHYQAEWTRSKDCARTFSMNMQQRHAAWTCSKDMQHGHAACTYIQHGHTACAYGMVIQHVTDMLHGHSAGNAAWLCSKNMQQ